MPVRRTFNTVRKTLIPSARAMVADVEQALDAMVLRATHVLETKAVVLAPMAIPVAADAPSVATLGVVMPSKMVEPT